VEQAKNGTGKGGRKALWAAVAVIAIAAAGLTGYKITLQNTITSQLEKRGGKAGSVEADFFGRIHLRDVTMPLKNGSEVRIGSIEGRPKFLFLTGMLDASDINTQVANYKISIPHVKIDDANFDISTLRETFGNSQLTVPERVGRFSAKSVVAPEINLVQTIAGNEQKVSYKDVKLEDIKQGQVARFSAAGTTFEFAFEVPKEEGEPVRDQMQGSMGLTEGKDIDAVYLARLYMDKAGPDDKDAKPVYGPFSAKNIVMKSREVNFSYDEIRSNGFSMRMPAEPLLDMVQQIEAVKNPEDLTPAEQREFFLRLLSIVDTIGKGDMELLGLKIEPSDTTKGKGDIAQISIAFDNSKIDATVKGINIGDGTDHVKVDEASMQGFSWAPTAEALKKLAALSDEEAVNFPFTTLLPEFGTMRIAGVDADLPYEPEVVNEVTGNDETTDDAGDQEAVDAAGDDAAVATDDQGVDIAGAPQDSTEEPATEGEDAQPEATEEAQSEPAEEAKAPTVPERIKFSLKNYEVALNKPQNGIPTDIRVTYEDMTLPVPQSGNDEIYDQLRKLGYDKVTISSNMAMNWDEPNQNLVISDISVSGKDMGSVSVNGLMGGFTKEFFSGDKVMTQVAALGLKAREVKVKVEEKGLIAKALKLYAEENDMTEDEVRSTFSMIAAAFLQELATDQPKLQDAVTAFSTFLAKPNIFELTVTSKAEKGIGALEMISASQDPLSLLDKVNIEAKAE